MATQTQPDVAEMIERGAPHVIHNDDELATYTDQLFALTALETPSLSQVQAIELLSLLVQTYEAKVYPIPDASPIEVLKFLMESNNLTQSDLQQEIGSQAFVSRILRGERQLTATHIKALAARFNLPASVFIEDHKDKKILPMRPAVKTAPARPKAAGLTLSNSTTIAAHKALRKGPVRTVAARKLRP